MFIPYRVDVPMERLPWGNLGLIGAMVLMYIIELQAGPSAWHWMVLSGWAPWQLVGHQFLHADVMHLVGNLLFLWLFGNAVCAKLGSLRYILLFLLTGICAGICHLLLDGGPMIGASGAINGIVGMYLIFFPRNNISCVFFYFTIVRTFAIASGWMIIFWFAGDCWGALMGGRGIAYLAHIGGFISGVTVAWQLISRWGVRSAYHEENLLEIWRLGPYRDLAAASPATGRRPVAQPAGFDAAFTAPPERAPRTITRPDFADELIARVACEAGIAPSDPPPQRREGSTLIDFDGPLGDDVADDSSAAPPPEIRIDNEDFRPPAL